MATERPRRLTQRTLFVEPSESDIYDTQSDVLGANLDVSTPQISQSELDPIERFLRDTQTTENPSNSPGLTQQSIEVTPTPITLPPSIVPLKRAYRTPRSGKKRDEELWRHARDRRPFEKEHNARSQPLFYCLYCDWVNVSSNASLHLTTHKIYVGKHSITASQKAQANALRTGLENQSIIAAIDKEGEQARTALKNAADKQLVRNNMAKFMACCSISAGALTHKTFHDLVLSINPQAGHCLLRARASIWPRVERNFQLQQRAIIDYLASSAISCIHLSTDTWKTKHGRKNFQAVNAQFVDDKGVLRQLLLDLRQLDEERSHDGAHLSTFIINVCKDYNLIGRLGWITSDNVTTNDTLIRSVERFMRENGCGEFWTEKGRRLRCIGHIINLVTHAFMFAKEKKGRKEKGKASQQVSSQSASERASDGASDKAADQAAEEDYEQAELSRLLPGDSTPPADTGLSTNDSLSKLKAMAIALRDPKWWTIFKKVSSTYFPDLSSAVPKIPGETRWNGWLLMIEESMQARPILEFMWARYSELHDVSLSDDDWSFLSLVYAFLQPFKEVTKKLEGHTATLDAFQPSMEYLKGHLDKQEQLLQHQPTLTTPVRLARKLFDKYYKLIDETAAYVVAVLLHPGRRLRWLRNRWTPQAINAALPRARTLWQSYKQQQPAVESNELNTDGLSELEQWQIECDNEVVSSDEDEFDTFINAQPIRLLAGVTVIEWWCQQRDSSSTALSQLAIDVLSASLMSAESERTFSMARRTTDWSRSQLTGDHTRELELTKAWQEVVDNIMDSIDVDDDIENV